MILGRQHKTRARQYNSHTKNSHYNKEIVKDGRKHESPEFNRTDNGTKYKTALSVRQKRRCCSQWLDKQTFPVKIGLTFDREGRGGPGCQNVVRVAMDHGG